MDTTAPTTNTRRIDDDLRDALQAHIDELAAQYGIQVDQRYNLSGMMYVEETPPRIETPTLVPCRHAPSVALCYMVALHEIGHVVHGHTQGRPPHQDKIHYFDNGVLQSEAEAWTFALKQRRCALEEWEAKYMAEKYFGSYRNRAVIEGDRVPRRLLNGNRHHVEFYWDNPNDRYILDVLFALKTSHIGAPSLVGVYE